MTSLSRIAYVDDEDDIRELAGLVFETIGGFDVRLYASGFEALEGLPAFRPDLVVLDVMMPGMDGMEVFRRISDHETLSAVPIIFMTAMTSGLHRLQELEPAGILQKPFDPVDLCNVVERLWTTAMERREHAMGPLPEADSRVCIGT